MGYIINFDSHWKFKMEDIKPYDETDDWGGAKARAYDSGAASEVYDDSSCHDATVPHDFVVRQNYCFISENESQMTQIPEMESISSRLIAGGCLEGRIAWYRKRFHIGRECADKRIHIRFDGVYRNSKVYINQYYVGTHPSGYSGFYYDITDFVNIGKDNIIAVRVDATGREGWWYEGGGIYRHVWLEIYDSVSVKPQSAAVRAIPDLDEKTVAVLVTASIQNFDLSEKTVRVETEIDGIITDKIITVPQWDSVKYSAEIGLCDVALWDIDDPHLYKAAIRVYDMDRLCDQKEIEFGIREMHFDADNDFYLNGKNLQIKGICLHHDHAGMPKQPIIITEASSNSGTRGCYSTDRSKGHYYILDDDNEKKFENKKKAVKKNVGEGEWKYFAERPYLSGIFIWTGIDYRGEPTPLGLPAVYSQFGVMDYCGFKKDSYYYYKSQ